MLKKISAGRIFLLLLLLLLLLLSLFISIQRAYRTLKQNLVKFNYTQSH